MSKKQVISVLLLELTVIGLVVLWSTSIWCYLCPDSTLESLNGTSFQFSRFLFYALLRPFLFIPTPALTLVAGVTFGEILGTLLANLGLMVSTVAVFAMSRMVLGRTVRSWLTANAPKTYQRVRSQDWKLILILRFLSLAPFDFSTAAFALFEFRLQRVIFLTALFKLPECYLYVTLGSNGFSLVSAMVVILGFNILITSVFFIALDLTSRFRGSSLLVRMRALWWELIDEVRFSNDINTIIRSQQNRIAVVLIYGYFSSQSALKVLERSLQRQGFDVISYNLGGVLGAFFTNGIIDSAKNLDHHIRNELVTKYDEIKVVGHSKGGLVGLWWLLKLGGEQYCSSLITMGTPFKGSPYSWIGLATPAGHFFQDIWQMRPGSELLNELHKVKIPENVKIYNLYSYEDGITSGQNGVLNNSSRAEAIKPIYVEGVTHFEFLYSPKAMKILVDLLGE